MRSLSFILAIFFAFLLTAPCSDVLPLEQQHLKIEKKQDSSTEGRHSDNCSPFCSCSCCGANFSVPTVDLLEFATEPAQYSYNGIVYHSIYYTGISFRIWQPPKIG